MCLALYRGQLVDAATVVIELWARGDVDVVTIDEWTIPIGLLEVPGQVDQQVGTVYETTLCVAAVTGDGTDFGDYMTSCSRGGPPPAVVATPVISPDSGVYAGPITVSFTCATPSAILYFTLDGTDPDISKLLYTGPFGVSVDTVVRVIGTLSGAADSGIAEADYTFDEAVYDLSWQAIVGLEDGAGGPVVFATQPIAGDYPMDGYYAATVYSGQWECPIEARAPTAFLASSGGPFVPAPMNSAPPFNQTDANGFPYADAGTARLYQTTAIYPQNWTLRIT